MVVVSPRWRKRSLEILNRALNAEWKDGFMIKYSILLLFVLMMVAIDVYSNKKVSSIEDFLLGGRQMGP